MARELTFEMVPLKELKPFAGNPRKISEKGLEKLQNSIAKFGFVNPVLAQKGTGMIIAGHQRLKAAEDEGLLTVPVIWLDMTDTEAKAYNIADNRTAQESMWDDDSLTSLMQELEASSFDLTFTGFDKDEIDDILRDVDGTFEEAQPRAALSLSDRFVIAPFSVFDARRGWWTQRKAQWISLGLKSHLGRGRDLLNLAGTSMRAEKYAIERRIKKEAQKNA